MKSEYEELWSELKDAVVKDYPDLSAKQVVDGIYALVVLAVKHRRYCARHLNDGSWTEAEYNVAIANNERGIASRVEKYFPGSEPVFYYDPRGATVHIELPHGGSNSMGGRGWIVPTI